MFLNKIFLKLFQGRKAAKLISSRKRPAPKISDEQPDPKKSRVEDSVQRCLAKVSNFFDFNFKKFIITLIY